MRCFKFFILLFFILCGCASKKRLAEADTQLDGTMEKTEVLGSDSLQLECQVSNDTLHTEEQAATLISRTIQKEEFNDEGSIIARITHQEEIYFETASEQTRNRETSTLQVKHEKKEEAREELGTIDYRNHTQTQEVALGKEDYLWIIILLIIFSYFSIRSQMGRK